MLCVFQAKIDAWQAIPLELISWVLGVLQVALGLNLIFIALVSLHVIPPQP
jgi:hypothetical protein